MILLNSKPSWCRLTIVGSRLYRTKPKFNTPLKTKTPIKSKTSIKTKVNTVKATKNDPLKKIKSKPINQLLLEDLNPITSKTIKKVSLPILKRKIKTTVVNDEIELKQKEVEIEAIDDNLNGQDIPTSKLLITVKQYQESHPQHLALIRVGDFYEIYYDQATRTGTLLGMLVVTKMVKGHSYQFTGFPARHLDRHLETLVERNQLSVAVMEQYQDSITKQYSRRVDRIYTPGTLVAESFLDGLQYRFLLSLTRQGEGKLGMAWVDVTTGDFYNDQCEVEELGLRLARLRPKELVLSSQTQASLGLELSHITSAKLTIEDQSDDAIDMDDKVQLVLSGLDMSFDGSNELIEIEASIQLIKYLMKVQGNTGLNLKLQRHSSDSEVMKLDGTVITSLDLNQPRSRSSLLFHINQTVTKPGSRLLQSRVMAPSTHRPTIQSRLDLIKSFLTDRGLVDQIRNLLKDTKDIQRSVQKLALNYRDPKDLLDIKITLKNTLNIVELLNKEKLGKRMKTWIGDIPIGLDKLVKLIDNTLMEESDKLQVGDGVIRPGLSEPLILLKNQLIEAEDERDKLEVELKVNLSCKSLKLTSSLGFGPLLEIQSRDSSRFAHHVGSLSVQPLLFQSLKGKHRYHHPTWTSLAHHMSDLSNQITDLERQLLDQLTNQILQYTPQLHQLSTSLAELDIASTMGYLIKPYNLTLPTITDSDVLEIKLGRHLVVQESLANKRVQFTPNDCVLTAQTPNLSNNINECQGWIITGPNMGGKSTFLRQVALLCIMGQAGLPVPADKATIGVVDQIFSRVGSGDNLYLNQSTFMVEMQEAANILKNATYKSLVIIDELGRGTSAQDGQSLAYAVLKYLHDRIGCRLLFATHFHDLAFKAKSLGLTKFENFHTQVMELEEDRFAFLHSLQPGPAQQSHALKVARMAGLPIQCLNIAESYLNSIDQDEEVIPKNNNNTTVLEKIIVKERDSKIEQLVKEVDLDHCSPIQAWQKLKQIQDVLIENK